MDLYLISVLSIEQTTFLHSTQMIFTNLSLLRHSLIPLSWPLPTAHSVVPSQSRGNHRFSYKAASGFTRL